MTPNRQAEIRAAAERVADETSDYKYWYGNATRCPMADAKLVAAAYLAEHPADEDLPIDAEFLKACWFEPHFDKANHREWRIDIDDGRWLAMFAPDDRTWATCIEGGSNYASLPDQFTRGDLRRLAAALGIELRNPQ